MIKEININVLITLFLVLIIACQKDDGTSYYQTSDDDIKLLEQIEFVDTPLKGWELYSWNENNVWNFSILPGTNRVKTYSEVTSVNTEVNTDSKISSIRVKGVESIKIVLNNLKEGETITWLGEGWLKRCWSDNPRNLCIPDSEIFTSIKNTCKENDVILWIAN